MLMQGHIYLYRVRPSPSQPSAPQTCRCTRIWCVLPVLGRHSTTLVRPSGSANTSRNFVMASLETDMRLGSKWEPAASGNKKCGKVCGLVSS